MGVIFKNLEIFILVIINRFRATLDPQPGQCAGYTGQLRLHLLPMIQVKVAIYGANVDFAQIQITLLSQHMSEQSQ